MKENNRGYLIHILAVMGEEHDALAKEIVELEKTNFLAFIAPRMKANPKEVSACLKRVLDKPLTELIKETNAEATSVFNHFYKHACEPEITSYIAKLTSLQTGWTHLKFSLTPLQQSEKATIVVEVKPKVTYWKQQLDIQSNTALSDKIAQLEKMCK
ncbi:MAG: hypothetical protein KDK65_03995 [Chlamydiia bacterium]|nr:hypothetical protein [Chlamydiia bacterium]